MPEKQRDVLGKPRQIRLPADVESDLEKIAKANGLQWVDAVRLAARWGLPILKKRMGDSVKAAA